VKYNYEFIKQLAKALKRPASTLYALSSHNDPFYIAPYRQRDGQWFAGLFRRFGKTEGVYLRRLHYWLISGKVIKPTMHDGTPYENTEKCWQALLVASTSARYLGLVPIESFIDQRNPGAIIDDSSRQEPDIWVNPATLDATMPPLPDLYIEGASQQRYRIEIWCEKSSMNDILVPLARRYAAHLITGIGELSTTRCHECVERALLDGRPVRIIYVSDFDPGGESMPLAVARKIEFMLRDRDLDLDIQVRNVVLTHEQCRIYALPRTPIKESESRIGVFEQKYGEGATELDALEANHPGELERILTGEILRYYDSGLAAEHDAAAEQVAAELDRITGRVHRRHAKEIKKLRAEYRDWAKRAKVVWRRTAGGLPEPRRVRLARTGRGRRGQRSVVRQQPRLRRPDRPLQTPSGQADRLRAGQR
jgi:hypothetical protein